MRSPELCFFFAVALVTVLVVAGVALLSSQARHRTLDRLAKRFRGAVEGAGIFSLPRFRMRHSGAQVLLSYTMRGKNRRYTHLQINWPDSALRMEIYPQAALSSQVRKLWGMEDIQVGSPQFDADFFISGNNPTTIRSILGMDVQQQIYALAGLGISAFWTHNDVYVEVAGGVLKVTKPTYLSSYDDLERFIAFSLKLYDHALTTRASGIEFLESATPPDALEPQCQVCGDVLVADVVYCRSCHTPHHRECWQYFGSCSVYACKEQQFVASTPKRRVRKK